MELFLISLCEPFRIELASVSGLLVSANQTMILEGASVAASEIELLV